jgi:hypothetical protein
MVAIVGNEPVDQRQAIAYVATGICRLISGESMGFNVGLTRVNYHISSNRDLQGHFMKCLSSYRIHGDPRPWSIPKK